VACRKLDGFAAFVGHRDATLTSEPSVTAHQIDVRAAQPIHLTRIVPVSCEGVTPGQNRRDVQAPGDSLPRTRDILGFGERLNWSQQGFTRHACPIGALATDEISLDNHRAQSPFNSPVGDVFAGGTAANNNYVILSSSHGLTSM
jgi:hypothetical protein